MSLALALAATGCDDPRSTTTTSERPTPSTGDYEVVEVSGGGSLSGRVVWVGPLPDPVTARGSMDPELCGAESTLPLLRIGARGGVADTVIVIDGIRSGRAVETSDSTLLRATGCAFSPHVLAVGRGRRLRIENGDPVVHDARASDGRGSLRFDIGLPTLGASSEVALGDPAILRVVDDAGHPGMLAWVHVVEHPYFAVSDDDGRFRIEGVPPGTYTVRVWHEGVRANESGVVSAPMLLSRTVTILGGHDSSLDFQLDVSVAEAAGE